LQSSLANSIKLSSSHSCLLRQTSVSEVHTAFVANRVSGEPAARSGVVVAVGAEDQARFGVRVVAEAHLVRSFRGVGKDQDVAAKRSVGVVNRLREHGETCACQTAVGVPVGLGLNDVALRIVEVVVREAGSGFVAGAKAVRCVAVDLSYGHDRGRRVVGLFEQRLVAVVEVVGRRSVVGLRRAETVAVVGIRGGGTRDAR
jgi:hypothetical protein